MRKVPLKVARVTSNGDMELIYIPKQICETLGLRRGTYVKMSVEDGKLVVEPLKL
mgnify:CR=1 FL=1